MIDLDPATRVLGELVAGVRDDQLDAPTPCAATSVAALLDHVDGLSFAFTAAARKTKLPPEQQTPRADAAHLAAEWQSRIPQQLAALAAAWRDEDAWVGMTQIGGVDVPGEVAALIAIDEVVVHGWDVAVSTGQSFVADEQLVEAAYGFVQPQVKANPAGTPGLFGPALSVPDGASSLDRLLRSTGRDPSWRGEGSVA
jgi:uncharacterized protein (TIGR03086 family)